MSDGLKEKVTIFSEINYAKRCFVGDYFEWTEGGQGWTGDEASVITRNGKVRIMYVDEVRTPPSRGFFSRMMGL